MPDSTYARWASCVACGNTTMSPSTKGSWVSTSRLNGAYFSRAIRSQVSSTASKVSREWSPKRARSHKASVSSHS